MSSYQSGHFTSPKYVNLFLDAGIRIRMDHRVRVIDNIFVTIKDPMRQENLLLLRLCKNKERARNTLLKK